MEPCSLEVLFDASRGMKLPSPPDLKSIYGDTCFPSAYDSGYIFANFVSTLDGVVSLGAAERHRGGEISGFNVCDRLIMGLLRAVADFVLVGAGAVRALPDHLWTPECICPEMGAAYQQLRRALGKPPQPTTIIVTGDGKMPPDARVFEDTAAAPLILTNDRGAQALKGHSAAARIVPVKRDGSLTPAEILGGIIDQPTPQILIEAGPGLTAEFLAAACLNELFLTLSPQIAGREGSATRPGFIQGRLFAPDSPVWGELISVRRGGHHLFLRYVLSARQASSSK